MRLLSLTVRDFRGLGEARIEPAPQGVTVVTGPNESGKTSLVEAFDLLLDKLDNSVAGEVREAQPVGRDVGPEVEAEIEAGDYRFRLRKRFVKSPQTELVVLAPRPQQLTGREAHERAMEILATAGVDLDLWRALRVEQGQGVQQPEDLATSRSLLDALGGAGERTEGGGRAAELHELARQEYERYFTPKRGEPTGELRQARDELEQAAAAAEALESRAARLDADAARADQLERRLVELRGLAAAAAERRESAAAEAKKVGELAAEVERRRSQAREEEEVRDRLRELAEAGEAEREVGGRLEAARAGAGEAAAALAPAETELEGAVAAAREAEQNRERLAAALRIAERWEARQRTADELVR
ncbi:MAG TPA: AAA family ATPase, partial [Thermoanaerobaculia bacterium]|nr:AAA family ATPase [Thermoanaerobaculia bacterium]